MRYRTGHAVDGRVLVLQRGDVAVDLLHLVKLLIAIHVAELVHRLADQGAVNTALLLRFEHVFDRHRAAPTPHRMSLLLRHLNMRVKIENHGKPQRVATGAMVGESSSRVLPAVSIEKIQQVMPPTMANRANMPYTPPTP